MVYFQAFANTPPCIGPRRCRVVSGFTVILPNTSPYASKIDCPSQIPLSGVYRTEKKGSKVELFPVWQFDKAMTSFSCGEVEIYLSEKGDSLLAFNDGASDLYQNGKVVKKIEYTDVNIKQIVAPNLAIDEPGQYDGKMTISKTGVNGFEISNGKKDIFVFDWSGKQKSQEKSK